MTMTTHSAKVTLPSDTEILIEREFDAPPELVWEAFTTPEHVRRWWTAKRGEVTVCEIDLRPGGKWRYVMIANGDVEVGFHGEYREIDAPHRLVSTEAYEGIPDADANAAVNTMTLTALDGSRTRMEILVEHPTKEGRDGHIESGMEGGLQDALDLLEEVAASL
jgi:uncharacterized protein YndB with AHSA1/START domain